MDIDEVRERLAKKKAEKEGTKEVDTKEVAEKLEKFADIVDEKIVHKVTEKVEEVIEEKVGGEGGTKIFIGADGEAYVDLPPSEREPTNGVITVTKLWKDSGRVTTEEITEERIDILVPVAGVPLANVGSNLRMTINLGNYETIQVGAHCSLPCYPEEIAETYKAAKTFVDHRVTAEVAEVREYRKKKGGGD